MSVLSLRCRHCQRRRLLRGQSAEAGETYMRRTCQHGRASGEGCWVVEEAVPEAGDPERRGVRRRA